MVFNQECVRIKYQFSMGYKMALIKNAASYYIMRFIYYLCCPGTNNQFIDIGRDANGQFINRTAEKADPRFSLAGESSDLLESLILNDLVEIPDAFYIDYTDGIGTGQSWWGSAKTTGEPTDYQKALLDTGEFRKMRDKKTLIIPSLSCTPPTYPNSTNDNLAQHVNNLTALLRLYRDAKEPLPEKIIFNSGSYDGIHIITLVFNFKTGKIEVADDIGEGKNYTMLIERGQVVMNTALRNAQYDDKQFYKYSHVIQKSVHTWSNNPLSTGPGTCYISAMITSILAAKYDDIEQGMCDFVAAFSGKLYTKQDLRINKDHAFGKASHGWFISNLYNLAAIHPEEGHRLNRNNWVSIIRDFATQKGLKILGHDHPCIKMMEKNERDIAEHTERRKVPQTTRAAPTDTRTSKAAAETKSAPRSTTAKPTHDVPAEKPAEKSAPNPNDKAPQPVIVTSYKLRQQPSKAAAETKSAPRSTTAKPTHDVPAEKPVGHKIKPSQPSKPSEAVPSKTRPALNHESVSKDIRKLFSKTKSNSKAGKFFRANISWIRKVPILRAIVEWFLFSWPFNKLFQKYSFESKVTEGILQKHRECFDKIIEVIRTHTVDERVVSLTEKKIIDKMVNTLNSPDAEYLKDLLNKCMHDDNTKYSLKDFLERTEAILDQNITQSALQELEAHQGTQNVQAKTRIFHTDQISHQESQSESYTRTH